MKLKGLQETLNKVEKMQSAVNDKIDALDQDGSKWEEKDNFYNDVWMSLDAAMDNLKEAMDMKLEDYL